MTTMTRRYHGPKRFFGIVLIAPRWPFQVRVDLLMRAHLEKVKP